MIVWLEINTYEDRIQS